MKEPVFLENVSYMLPRADDMVIKDVSVRVEEGEVDSMGRDVEAQRGDEVIDCKGCVLIPGLVNCHTHSSMVALRGLNDDAPLDKWLESMWEVEENLKGDIARKASEAAFLEMIRTGTTACLDMYEAREAARAALNVGIRMANGPALISRFAPPKERLKETRSFAMEYAGHDRIIPVVNLHSIYTNDESTIEKAGELSRDLDIPLHVHISETRKEVFGNRRERERLGVEELQHCGVLWEKAILVHLGWAASWEFNRIMDAGAKVVHCPTSNMKLGTGGFFPYKEIKDGGITVGLGTDSAASNNSLDMFREMKQMTLKQKSQYWESGAAGALDSLRCATVNGARILGYEGGRIAPALRADMTLMRIEPSMMPLRSSNLPSALVYSATGCMVRMTMVGGDILYLDGKLRDGSDHTERARELYDDISAELF